MVLVKNSILGRLLFKIPIYRPNYCPKIVPVTLNFVLTSHVPFFLACNRTPLIFLVVSFLRNELITNETPSIGLILIAGSLLYSNSSK